MVASGRQQRRNRSRAEADQLAVEYEASGLSQKEFCQQRELSFKALGRYLTRYRKQKAQGAEPHKPPRFVAVEVAHPRCGGGKLAVLLSSGLRVEVKPGFDAGTLRQLIAVLEA
jgi:hypothetical protein